MKSQSLDKPKPITVQAAVGDTTLIRLADNIVDTRRTTVTDIEGGKGRTAYEYDEVVLQLLITELPYVKNNFKTYFKIGLKLESTFDPATNFYYHQHTNFLAKKRALVRVIAPDKTADKIEVPTALEAVDTLYTDKIPQQIDKIMISTDAWIKQRVM